MSILHRHVLRILLRNLALSLMVFTLLFLAFDFFDRIDNILPEDADPIIVAQYFLYKIPLTVSLMLPVAMLVATMFTIGLLSRNSELTAMRAAGVTVFWIAKPVFAVGIALSFLSIVLNETLVPYSTRRVKEIYNIDILQKHKTGGYSQSDFWWRSGKSFYYAGSFDSRTNRLLDFSAFHLSPEFEIERRSNALEVRWVDPYLGWSMTNVAEYQFDKRDTPSVKNFEALPLPILEKPKDFYATRTDPHTMSFGQLREFIRGQAANGVSISAYLADLHEKIAFPFISFVITLIVLPFALQPARSGSMAFSFLAGLIIGFSYYAVHSFSIAMGRAELWGPVLSAWMANIIMGIVGVLLNLGTESPN